jgi:hypothetical protein
VRILGNFPDFSKQVWTSNKFSSNLKVVLLPGILIQFLFGIWTFSWNESCSMYFILLDGNVWWILEYRKVVFIIYKFSSVGNNRKEMVIGLGPEKEWPGSVFKHRQWTRESMPHRPLLRWGPLSDRLCWGVDVMACSSSHGAGHAMNLVIVGSPVSSPSRERWPHPTQWLDSDRPWCMPRAHTSRVLQPGAVGCHYAVDWAAWVSPCAHFIFYLGFHLGFNSKFKWGLNLVWIGSNFEIG